VHDHSITRDHRIDRRADRINLDTGAFTSGVLSSLRLDPAAWENSSEPTPEAMDAALASRRLRMA